MLSLTAFAHRATTSEAGVGLHLQRLFLRLEERENVMALCPECDTPLDIDEEEVEEGDTITCNECGSDIEVVSSDPLELASVEEEGYDDEDDTPAREYDVDE